MLHIIDRELQGHTEVNPLRPRQGLNKVPVVPETDAKPPHHCGGYSSHNYNAIINGIMKYYHVYNYIC